MKYLLDTDHITFLQRRSGPEYAVLAARMAQHSLADFAYSIVSFHEQILGGHALTVFDNLQVPRIRVATMDLRIASIALSRGLILLTRNRRDFSRVPGLVSEDWTR